MFGWFKKSDPQLDAARKTFTGLVYKESKGGGDREVFWVGRAGKTNSIRVGIKFYDRTYFLDANEFSEDLKTREGWAIVRQAA